MTYEEAVRNLDAQADAHAADPDGYAGWAVWRLPEVSREAGEDLPWRVSIGDGRWAFGPTREAAVIHAGEMLKRRLDEHGSYTHRGDE